MLAAHIVFQTTRNTLGRLIQRYWQVYNPPGSGPLGFWRDPDWPAPRTDGDVEEMRYICRGALWETGLTSLFKLRFVQRENLCEVEIECLEPYIESWLARMIEWLAPNRSSGQVQPLPKFPPPQRAATAPVDPKPSAPEVPNEPASSRIPGRLSPGVKGFTEEEVDELIRRWYGRPKGMTVEQFCNREGLSPTTLRKYVPMSIRWQNSGTDSDASSEGDPSP